MHSESLRLPEPVAPGSYAEDRIYSFKIQKWQLKLHVHTLLNAATSMPFMKTVQTATPSQIAVHMHCPSHMKQYSSVIRSVS